MEINLFMLAPASASSQEVSDYSPAELEPDSDLYKKYKERFEQVAKAAIAHGLLDPDFECSVTFMDDYWIQQFNRDYRKIDRPTDVLSFAIQEAQDPSGADQDLGDIFINLEAVERQAHEYGHSTDREGTFLFTHGLLHLLGFDHIEAEDEKKMREWQRKLLDQVVTR